MYRKFSKPTQEVFRPLNSTMSEKARRTDTKMG